MFVDVSHVEGQSHLYETTPRLTASGAAAAAAHNERTSMNFILRYSRREWTLRDATVVQRMNETGRASEQIDTEQSEPRPNIMPRSDI